jgi:hypothetical protein
MFWRNPANWRRTTFALKRRRTKVTTDYGSRKSSTGLSRTWRDRRVNKHDLTPTTVTALYFQIDAAHFDTNMFTADLLHFDDFLAAEIEVLKCD